MCVVLVLDSDEHNRASVQYSAVSSIAMALLGRLVRLLERGLLMSFGVLFHHAVFSNQRVVIIGFLLSRCCFVRVVCWVWGLLMRARVASENGKSSSGGKVGQVFGHA